MHAHRFQGHSDLIQIHVNENEMILFTLDLLSRIGETKAMKLLDYSRMLDSRTEVHHGFNMYPCTFPSINPVA